MRHMKKSRNIAVVTTYISDYIFPRLIQGMDNVLSEQGYSIILKNTGNRPTPMPYRPAWMCSGKPRSFRKTGVRPASSQKISRDYRCGMTVNRGRLPTGIVVGGSGCAAGVIDLALALGPGKRGALSLLASGHQVLTLGIPPKSPRILP